MPEKKQLKINAVSYGLTDIGGRKSNQDSFFCNDESQLYLVADGIGGHTGGDIASLFTSDKMNQVIDQVSVQRLPMLNEDFPDAHYEPTIDTMDDAFFMYMIDNQTVLRHTLWFTNGELFKRANAHAAGSLRQRKMGTTLTAVWLKEDKLIFMNVGDSRAYILWEDTLQRVTHDHSKLEDIIREGELSEQEARHAQSRNIITRAIGTKSNVIADFYVRPLYSGMRIILCTDGLYDLVSNDDLLHLGAEGDIEQSCQALIAKALAEGQKKVIAATHVGKRASYDNMTVLMIDVGGYVIRKPNTP